MTVSLVQEADFLSQNSTELWCRRIILGHSKKVSRSLQRSIEKQPETKSSLLQILVVK